MSFQVLQRTVVRMLFDAAWVEAVYGDPDAALAGLELTADEKRWLHAPDPRRWRADPERRLRALQGLLEEYPVAFAQAVSAVGFEAVEGFFSSGVFHGGMANGGSLALTFGGFLQSWSDSVSIPAKLETAMAAVRRGRPKAPGPWSAENPRWQIHPGVVAILVPSGTMGLWQQQTAWLSAHGESLVGAVLSPAYPALEFPAAAPSTGVLVTMDAGVSVGECTVELATFLMALEQPLPRSIADGHLRASGAEPGEETEILTGLVEDGFLLCLRGV